MSKHIISIAVEDISSAINKYYLVGVLGWQDINQRYRRSALGPFWLTLSMAVMIGSIGVVFGTIFKNPMDEFLPFLSVGLIFWTYISSCINEGCSGFVAAEGIIKQLPIPLFVHILRLIWRNLLILFHNLIIIPVVFLIMGKTLGWVSLYSIIGLVLITINLTWIALLLSVFCTRYRDLPQIVGSILQVVFYVTPIIWMPNLMSERTGISLVMLQLNPFTHFLEVVRAPLLGSAPTLLNWCVVGGWAIAGWLFTILVYGRFKRRIAYWL